MNLNQFPMQKMRDNSQNLGKNGEQEAVKFLEEKGLTIMEINWRTGKLEIDIIAKDKEELVIVEVKARATNAFGEPEVFVNKRKQNHLIKAANAYILQKDFIGETRFDVIAITEKNSQLMVKHIPNAFAPSII
jgi:putative endonuclease